MKLSQLINYLQELENIPVQNVARLADHEVEKVTYLADTHQIQLQDFAKRLKQDRAQIQDAIHTFEKNVEELKVELKNLIRSTEKFWFQESYRIYEKEAIYESTENILDRRLWIPPETEQFFRSRLSRYNSWKHPAMIIRPGVETYINELLGADPLYLVDESYDLLQPAVNLFNPQYQQRLRQYVINERSGDAILQKLPDGQFGVVFAYHFFNFRPFEVIKKYFAEIYQKLRPGGVLVMTFNDCDREKGVINAERNYGSYTPGYLIKELAQSMGFAVAFSWHNEGPSTWIEFVKPGEFVSLRGGQALAKIIPK